MTFIPAPHATITGKLGNICSLNSTSLRRGDPVYTLEQMQALQLAIERDMSDGFTIAYMQGASGPQKALRELKELVLLLNSCEALQALQISIKTELSRR